MELKTSNYIRISVPILDHKDRQTKLLVFGTRRSEVRAIDTKTWQKITDNQFNDIPQDIIDDLLAAEILVHNDEDELKTILTQNNQASSSNSTLSLTVQPTALCQLGCGYCGQTHTQHLMSEKDQAFFLDRVESKLTVKYYENLSIWWHGGEPLLGIQVMRQLSPKLLTLADKYNVKYLSNITTNGISLSHDMVSELVKIHKIKKFQVTLDGTAEYHDTRRNTKQGKPTFKTIFNNVVNLAQREDLEEFDIVIRCNIDSRNRDGVLPLLQLIKQAGIHKRVIIDLVVVHDWGNNEDSPAIEEFAAWEIEWFIKMKEMGFKLPALLPSRRKILCMASSPDAELVDAYGNLFNCTEFSYVPEYEVASKIGKTSYVAVFKIDKTSPKTPITNIFTLGHVSTGETTNNRQILGQFNQKVQDGEYPCSTCAMLPVCGGACPKLWLEGNQPCPTANYNIGERLLLEYIEKRMKDVSTRQSVASVA
jgi:uncharacterized protein